MVVLRFLYLFYLICHIFQLTTRVSVLPTMALLDAKISRVELAPLIQVGFLLNFIKKKYLYFFKSEKYFL